MPSGESLPALNGCQNWAAFLALDWADQKHAWSLLAAGEQQPERGWVDNTPEAIEEWMNGWRRRFGDGRIAVCLEQSRGSVVYLLGKYPQLELFPAPAAMVARLRQAFHPSGAKDDPSDADLQLTLLLKHGAQLRPLPKDQPAIVLLRLLVEDRRRLVNERTRQKNRLTSWLKSYYPQLLRWFSDISSPMALGFLKRWPSLQQVQRAHPGTLHRFFQDYRGKKPGFVAEGAAAVYAAIAATQDESVIEACSRAAQVQAGLIESLNAAIDGYDQRIEELVTAHPDGSLFASLPGAGPVMRARLLAALGEDRKRFADAAELQRYVGIAPVTERSGRSSRVHLRRGCSQFLRQTFQEHAALSRLKSTWAQAFYQSQKAAGKSHHAAVRALAFKWCRIIFRCWQDRTPYDEARYLESLEKRNSPLHSRLDGNTQLGWEQRGGFSKLVKKIS